MEVSDFLNIRSLIIFGHFNAILTRIEVWGTKFHGNPLDDRLEILFYENHLNNVFPDPIESNSHNGRGGDKHIGKRLDRFMVHKNLFEIFGNL